MAFKFLPRLNRKLLHYMIRHSILDTELYNLCKRYVDRFNGENNDKAETNGELALLKLTIGGKNPMVVFDVGANVGDWARLVLSINSNIQLHCFEPSQVTFKKMRKYDWPKNCLINNVGLGSKSEKRTMWVFEPGSGMNSLYKRHGLEDRGLGPQNQKELIYLKTLDEYCTEKDIDRIDFLKVDCEGHELEVFKGAERAFKQNSITAVQFEYGGCNIDSRVFLFDLFTFLENYNYRVYKLFPDGPRLIKHYSQRLENFQYANYLALPKNSELLP